MISYLTIPETGISEIMGFVGETFDSVSPIFLLIVGVLFTFIILEFIVSLFSRNKEE